MTDFFVLPGTRVPLGDSGDFDKTPLPGRSVPQDNPEIGDGGVVQVVDAEWARRAALAGELAEELAVVRNSLTYVAGNNKFGDCTEGIEFFERFTKFLEGWRAQLTKQAASIDELSLLCTSANTQLTGADDHAATDLEA